MQQTTKPGSEVNMYLLILCHALLYALSFFVFMSFILQMCSLDRPIPSFRRIGRCAAGVGFPEGSPVV